MYWQILILLKRNQGTVLNLISSTMDSLFGIWTVNFTVVAWADTEVLNYVILSPSFAKPIVVRLVRSTCICLIWMSESGCVNIWSPQQTHLISPKRTKRTFSTS